MSINEVETVCGLKSEILCFFLLFNLCTIFCRLMVHVETAFHTLRTYGFNDKDLDEVKGIIADTHIYLLCATIFISSIHVRVSFFYISSFFEAVIFFISSCMIMHT